jgi:hypothetical protein
MARNEDSVQFSLGELMKLEDQRVAENARDREARERAAVLAEAEAARREEAAIEARRRAEQEWEERRRRSELDDLARREAMQKATIEQARLEVEARARAEERERERQHELALQAARAAAQKPASLGPLIAATGLGGGLMLLITCIVHFSVTQPANERRLTELELRATTSEQRAVDLQTEVDKSRKTIAALEQKNASLVTENDALRAAPPVKNGPRPPVPPRPPSQPKKAEPSCVDDHDPMCFTIKSPAR